MCVMPLTKEEQTTLINLAKGGQYSGVARRKLSEFREQRGWSEAEFITALQQAEAESQDPGTDGATSA